MIGPVVLLDANVLYPSLLRNLLMHLATTGLLGARWTNQIHDEWIRNLLADRPDLTSERLQRTRSLMERAVPDALVEHFEALIPSLSLPDAGDRHVLAAAITAEAEAIVTWNLKHFPATHLQQYGLVSLTPDQLLVRLLDQASGEVRAAVEQLRQSLRAPPYSEAQLVERFRDMGLIECSTQLGLEQT